MSKIFATLLLCLALAAPLAAEEKKAQKPAGGPPPMLVATAEIVRGKAEPTTTFVGTVYFSRTSQVAAEVDGKVSRVYRKDGQTVKEGDRLILLDDGLLRTELAGTQAGYEQNLVDLEQAQRDYARIATLHDQDSIATTEYEAYGTRVNRLEKLSTVLKARLDRLLLEQEKKTIRVPFDGIIIDSLAEKGEWVKTGGVIATVADNTNLEVRVEIPASLITFLSPEREVAVTVGGKIFTGEFVTLIPKGDIATRTFTAKIKIVGQPNLIEGMEARVLLPTAAATDGLLVPRDAVTNSFGQDVVFTMAEGVAHMLPVQIVGYTSEEIAVVAPGLEAGQRVVTKGNERIRDGQAIRTGE